MRWLTFLLASLLTIAAMVWQFASADGSGGRANASEVTDVAEGETLYATYCAACHGTNLEGQANWRTPGEDGRLPAPPHDESGHTWHHGDKLLFDYTKLGGNALMAQRGVEFDSGMPGFGEQMTDTEIRNVLAYIKSTWPERVRTMQAERSAAETQ